MQCENKDLNELQVQHQNQVKTSLVLYKTDMMLSYPSLFSQHYLSQFYRLLRERKRERMTQALNCNEIFLKQILQFVQQGEGKGIFEPYSESTSINQSKTKSTLRQFYRQWCEDSPQLSTFFEIVAKVKQQAKLNDRILVPGCGLGRLVLELVQAGFRVQGNQVTYFMLYGSNFILNCAQQPGQFCIYPFIHNLSYYESEQHIFRKIRIPDKVASNVVPKDADFSIAAGQFTQIYGSFDQFDCIVTCFFLDTANNIYDYIETIANTIKSQGLWINYGPLLFHYRDQIHQVSVEISWETLQLYIKTKFNIIEVNFRQSNYCHDPNSRQKVIYKNIMFVARKIPNFENK